MTQSPTDESTIRHQQIVGWLVQTLGLYARLLSLGEVLPAVSMRLGDTAYIPDVFFVAAAHLDRLHETHLDGPADLVVEVATDGSAGADRGEKFYLYESMGVREYWLIDPRPGYERAEFYRLRSDGHYALTAPERGVFRSSALLDFDLRVEWLWQRPLPDAATVLTRVRGLPVWFGEFITRAMRTGQVPADLSFPG